MLQNEKSFLKTIVHKRLGEDTKFSQKCAFFQETKNNLNLYNEETTYYSSFKYFSKKLSK
jgi:hypothetical protein